MGLFYSLSYAVIKNNNKKTPKNLRGGHAEDTRILGDLVDFLFTHHARHVFDTRVTRAPTSRLPRASPRSPLAQNHVSYQPRQGLSQRNKRLFRRTFCTWFEFKVELKFGSQLLRVLFVKLTHGPSLSVSKGREIERSRYGRTLFRIERGLVWNGTFDLVSCLGRTRWKAETPAPENQTGISHSRPGDGLSGEGG